MNFFLRFLYIYIFLFILFTVVNYNETHRDLKFIRVTDYFFVTSAFLDERINAIRILFASTINADMALKIKVDNNEISNYTSIIYDECIDFDKDFDLKYGNTIIPYTKIPHFVYVNNNKISVTVNNRKKYFISVCITTMYNYYAKLMFTQLLEIYRNLGVNHFSIYYSSSSIEIYRILKQYENENILKLIYWERNNDTIRMRNFGQYLKTNDCLYRYMNVSEYIINTDLDEIIIPLKYNTLTKFVKHIYNYNYNVTLILFSSKMFIKNETVDREVKAKKIDYINLHKISDVNIFSIKLCCNSGNLYKKYIVRVADMIALHTHKVWKGNVQIYNVPYSEGYSRHTRRVALFMKRKYCKKMENDNNLTLLLPLLAEKYKKYE